MALYSIWLLLGGLPVPVHSFEQFGLGLSEHELDGVELGRVRGQGHGHEASIAHELLHKLAPVDGGVVEDQNQLLFVLIESIVGDLHELSSQELLHLAEEFDESPLCVDASPHFAHVHAVISEGADGIRLWGHLVAVDWVVVPLLGPRVGRYSSGVEGNFINPDEAAVHIMEALEEVNEPLSVSLEVALLHRVFVGE